MSTTSRWVRWLPLGVAVLLLLLKAQFPAFLSAPLAERVGVSWFWLVWTVLVATAAYLAWPDLKRFTTSNVGRLVAPAALLTGLIVSILFALDLAWNMLVANNCDACPQSRLLPHLFSAFGGP